MFQKEWSKDFLCSLGFHSFISEIKMRKIKSETIIIVEIDAPPYNFIF